MNTPAAKPSAHATKFHADVRKTAGPLSPVKIDVRLDCARVHPFVPGIETKLRAARFIAPVFLEVENEAVFQANPGYLTQPRIDGRLQVELQGKQNHAHAHGRR